MGGKTGDLFPTHQHIGDIINVLQQLFGFFLGALLVS
jgi:hypothetical protein